MKKTITSTKRGGAETHDFRTFLRDHFRAAVRRNPRFSLRSFALQLGVNHSTLSQILRNKRPLSSRSIESIGKKLGLSENLIQSYQHHSKKKKKATDQGTIRNFQFDLDTFQLLSAWWHQAILELTHVKGFQTDSRWIARRLGISVDEVNVALQRLLRLGLLEMSTAKRWTDKSDDAEFQTQMLPTTAARRVNKEIHELAINALKDSAPDTLAHSHMVIAIDSRTMSRLQAAADDFLNEVRALSQGDGAKDEVYQVAVSLFPLTKPQS